MPPSNVREIFLHSASEVLETMFFSEVLDEQVTETEDQTVGAEVSFHGKTSGRFGIRIPVETGRVFASSFLGADEVSKDQIGEVVCELSNMLCGSVLSKLESGERFELDHPTLENGSRPQACGCTFALEEGTITMWLALGDEGSGLTEQRGQASASEQTEID